MTKCLIFDLYGTLLDIGSPVARLSDRVGPEAARLADLWRAKQLEYAWVATFTGRYEPFWTLTGRALSHALGSVGLAGDSSLEDDLLNAYKAPDLYDEVPDALTVLQQQGHRLVVFSNGNPDMLDEALDAVGILDRFQAVVSVDPVRRFKPDQAVYAHATDTLAEPLDRILFLSSNAWDITGAMTFGWKTCWVNRKGTDFEFGSRDPSEIISSLSELPEKLNAGI